MDRYTLIRRKDLSRRIRSKELLDVMSEFARGWVNRPKHPSDKDSTFFLRLFGRRVMEYVWDKGANPGEFPRAPFSMALGNKDGDLVLLPENIYTFLILFGVFEPYRVVKKVSSFTVDDFEYFIDNDGVLKFRVPGEIYQVFLCVTDAGVVWDDIFAGDCM